MKNNKEELKNKVLELYKSNITEEEIKKEIDNLLLSDFINTPDFNFKENGFILPKIILYCVLNKITQDCKPFMNHELTKKYKELINNY